MRHLCILLLVGLMSQGAFAAAEKCPTGKEIMPSDLTQIAKRKAFACFKRVSEDTAEAATAPADLAKKITSVVCKSEIEKWNISMMKDVETNCGSSMKPQEMLPHLNKKLTEWITTQIVALRKQKIG